MRQRFLFASLLPWSAAVWGWAAPHTVQAQDASQEVRGTVLEAGTEVPVEGAMVLLFEQEGRRVGGVLTAANGFFRMFVPEPGRYRIRVDRIGYENTDTEPFAVPAGTSVLRRIETQVRPVQLAGLEVRGEGRCELRPEEGATTAVVWDEARKALAAATWTAERELYRFAWTRYERELSADGRRVLEEERTYDRRFTSRPFVAADPEQLAERGFVETPTFGTWRYYAPDADVLLSDAFLDTHCFRLQRTERNDEQLIGLSFEPIPGRRVPEVKGVLWLDQSTARLRSIEFGYVNLHSEVRGQYGGGEVILAELPNGTWIVTEWEIRMPSFVVEQDSRGRPRRTVVTGYRSAGAVVQRATTATGATVVIPEQPGH